MSEEYDIIVAGGGIAGMISATSAMAYSKQDLSVLVIDRNYINNAGMKTINGWVCGDAVGKNSIDYMYRAIGINWSKPEIEHPVRGVVAYSPDRETPIYFDGDGYILNRKLLPQRQLNDALKLGVEFEWNVNLTNLYYEDNSVKGVIGLKREGSKFIPYKKRAKLVIDCTGVISMLRTNLSIKSFIQRRIDKDDIESTGRYILEFDPARNDNTYFDPNYAIIHLDQLIAPGGYAWVFPKGSNKVNIGLGVQHKSLELRNKITNKNDDLKSLIDNYVRTNPVISNSRLANSDNDKGNAWGTWQVSVRRQNDCLVANGYILVGDAAWMPKPLDAGGIGPAIIGGVLAGKNAASAIEANDTSEEYLWQYNIDFINDYGYKTAGLEIFRRFLQTLSNEQLNYGMKHFLARLDIEKITKGEHPEFTHLDKLGMIIRSILHIKTAEGLRYTAKKNRILVEHYREYPHTPRRFEEWHNKLMHELIEAYERFPLRGDIYLN